MNLTNTFKLLSVTTTLLSPSHAFTTIQQYKNPSLRTYHHILSVSSAENAKTAVDLAKDFEETDPSIIDASTKSAVGGAKVGQAEVVLVGCGAPNRGMGWYHAVQMLEGR
jgi:hypothetical protein